ncbi:hypothetical protein JCM15519_15730 [Fundidesulfovibrio butyratiphilus]
MSSPLAKQRKSFVDRLLVGFHQRAAHGKRLEKLRVVLGETLQSLPLGGGGISMLDVGCGDMRLSESLAGARPDVELTCLDVYSPPQGGPDASRWAKYRRFDGTRLEFADKRYDVVLLVDVLHHAEAENRPHLLREAVRVGRHVIVKDHFQYGVVSNATLRLMDFVGNWGYGVSVPRRYFTPDDFGLLVASAGARERSRRVGVDLYGSRLLRSVIKPEYHFISVLEEMS